MNPAAIVEILLSNLWPLLPFRVIRSDEWGVRWHKWGTVGEPLKPGFHWVLYFFHPFERVSRGVGMIDLPTQSSVTADDYAVCYSANIGWRVVDPVAYFVEVDNVEHAVSALAAKFLAKTVRKQRYIETVKELDKLETACKAAIQRACKPWGVEITTLGFTDFVPSSQQVRLFQDGERSLV